MSERKPKTRGNGQGCVYKPKGSTMWTAQVTIGWKKNRAGTGLVPVKRTKGGFKYKNDAILYCATLYAASAKPDRVTLQQLYDDWDLFYSPRVGKSTMVNYSAAFKPFAPLHHIYIDLITAADLQQCMDDCPAGKRTHENMKCVAGLLWHYAYDRQLIDRDVTQNLYIGKGETVKREPITEKELKTIKSAIGKERYADYIFAQCYLGFRPGEFLALKKSDVHMESGQMIIVGGSKTDAGRDRSVPVPPPIREIIDIRLAQPNTDYLFPRAEIRDDKFIGWKPMSHEYYNKHIFKPMMKKLNIAEGKTPYCARHTYADKLKKARGDDAAKAALMGHTDYAFTQAAYQSVTAQDLKTIAKSIK